MEFNLDTKGVLFDNLNQMGEHIGTAIVMQTLFYFCLCVVLPIVIVWMTYRSTRQRENMRKEIILAALDKNADVDVNALVRKLDGEKEPPLLKEKLMQKLQRGWMFLIFGILMIVTLPMLGGRGFWPLFFAIPSLAVGIAYLISYSVGKKMLAKEVEAEERNKAAEKA
ncbi:MAG: hypothetical protein HUK01_08255 [Bacteroidaceae bacterium]|nr:hypothetical protein [Bacteroidaceae bacterium]